MADTLTLDTAVGHVLDQGGRVCLVGDDQQLGAIGAGGILTDLEAAHGAVRLTQLHRFTDPDEAAATLQVRDGEPDGHRLLQRLGTGSRSATPTVSPTGSSPPGGTTNEQGLDSLMLAPSRRQVADLNHRARTARLAGHSRRLAG